MKWVCKRGPNGECKLVPLERDNYTPRAFYFNEDTIREMWHPATGRYHTSKSSFRRDTKAAGCEEVGTEPIKYNEDKAAKLDHGNLVEDVCRAYDEVTSRR